MIIPMEYTFNVFNKLAADGVTVAVDNLLNAHLPPTDENERAPAPPVVVCIGSDLAIGDSLGPVTGSMLRYKTRGLGTFVYGTLKTPVTAKEIKLMKAFLKATHKDRKIIAIDAAVGQAGDIGLIKITDSPLAPGAGANKKLGTLGDVSVMGIVAEKSLGNYGLFNTTRLNLVYSMAEIVSDALSSLLWERAKRR